MALVTWLCTYKDLHNFHAFSQWPLKLTYAILGCFNTNSSKLSSLINKPNKNSLYPNNFIYCLPSYSIRTLALFNLLIGKASLKKCQDNDTNIYLIIFLNVYFGRKTTHPFRTSTTLQGPLRWWSKTSLHFALSLSRLSETSFSVLKKEKK